MELEKLKTASAIVTAVVVPVALAYVGNSYSSALKEREMQARFVELAIDVLRKPPEKGAEALRSWSVDVIDKYSGVPFSASVRQRLIESGSLPTSSGSRRISLKVAESEAASTVSRFRALGFVDVQSSPAGDGLAIITFTTP